MHPKPRTIKGVMPWASSWDVRTEEGWKKMKFSFGLQMGPRAFRENRLFCVVAFHFNNVHFIITCFENGFGSI